MLLLTMIEGKGTGRRVASLQDDAKALHAAVSDLVRVYQLRDRNQICCYDISVTQCYALEALVVLGPLRLGALAERMHLDKSTTSRVIKTLVRKGYARHAPDASDRRAVAVVVTAAGRRLHQRITQELVEQQALVLKDLDAIVRHRVVQVVGRLARAAEARVLCGAGCGDAGTCEPVAEIEA
jgi:DNA-binding MarR family transcriptional regulator